MPTHIHILHFIEVHKPFTSADTGTRWCLFFRYSCLMNENDLLGDVWCLIDWMHAYNICRHTIHLQTNNNTSNTTRFFMSSFTWNGKLLSRNKRSFWNRLKSLIMFQQHKIRRKNQKFYFANFFFPVFKFTSLVGKIFPCDSKINRCPI